MPVNAGALLPPSPTAIWLFWVLSLAVKSADLHQDFMLILKKKKTWTFGDGAARLRAPRRVRPHPLPPLPPPLLGGEQVVCFVCDFAVDRLLRQGWRTPERIITLVYTEMKTRKDGALARCQRKSQRTNCTRRKSPGQNKFNPPRFLNVAAALPDATLASQLEKVP